MKQIMEIDKDRLLNIIGSLGWELKKIEYTNESMELTINRIYDKSKTEDSEEQQQYKCTPV